MRDDLLLQGTCLENRIISSSYHKNEMEPQDFAVIKTWDKLLVIDISNKKCILRYMWNVFFWLIILKDFYLIH